MKRWQGRQNSESTSQLTPKAKSPLLAGVILSLALTWSLIAGENIPQKPFAQSVWLPETRGFIITPWYQYSEFFHIWRGRRQESIEDNPDHDGHGFDQNDGLVAIDYGLAR